MPKRFFLYLVGALVLIGALYTAFGTTTGGSYSLAQVEEIVEAPPLEDAEPGDRQFNVTLRFLSGPLATQTHTIQHVESANPLTQLPLAKGDTVVTICEMQETGEMIVGIDEFYKSRRILGLIVFLIVMILVITGENGFKALMALTVTLILLFGGMTTLLGQGYPPIWLALAACLLITVSNLILIAGWNKKALIAGVGTLGGVLMAGLFAWLASSYLHLTGYSDHESQYLTMLAGHIDLKGILICGMIIGALGAVMDVGIAIASAMHEIREANASYTRAQLFRAGMNIGRDTIGSMTNTLILAYTGASLTMILVFSLQGGEYPLLRIMNMEFISSEILRSLAGLFGMVLAIPLTAATAAFLLTSTPPKNS